MFGNLTAKLSSIFSKLRGRGTLSEADVDAALREIRISLLESDVALSVVKRFIAQVKEKAIGAEILSSLNPGHIVVKIVYDHLVDVLGSDSGDLKLQGFPAVILMVGLQGSGKTTTTAKLAKRLKEKDNKSVLLVSLDVYRPAAQLQLEILGKTIGVDSLSIIENQKPLDIAKRAMNEGRLGGYDVVVFDTAGRLQIDNILMQELQQIQNIVSPGETLLVADSLTGQDAVNVAKGFMENVSLTGVVLTRVDGDAKGGAALSMRSVTGCPIKFIGLGEKVDALEPFHPKRIADRILDMGDIVSLVEKTMETLDMENAEAMAKKLQQGGLDLSDFATQLEQMLKMGGIATLMNHMPGMEQIKGQIPAHLMDDKILKRNLAMIRSMTKEERKSPEILNASRKRRIAKGSGTQVQDVNRLLKMYQDMSDATKKFGKLAKLGKLGKLNFLKNGLKGFNPGRMK